LLIARPEFPWADCQCLVDTLVEILVRGLENPRTPGARHSSGAPARRAGS